MLPSTSYQAPCPAIDVGTRKIVCKSQQSIVHADHVESRAFLVTFDWVLVNIKLEKLSGYLLAVTQASARLPSLSPSP